MLTFVFGATPAMAQPHTAAYAVLAAPEQFSSISSQSLNTELNTATTQHFDQMLNLAATKSGPRHGFDVDAAIALAEQEVGTSRATGWSQPGECIMSARRWVQAGGGDWKGGGTPVTNYDTAERLPFSLVEPGDVIQYENIAAPHAWVSGVHTVLVTGLNEDGTLRIIESNVPFGSGLVTKSDRWLPNPPDGFQAVVWRF